MLMDLPHREYWYSFDELGEKPTVATLRKACPDETQRQHAFLRFHKSNPDDVRYLVGYLQAYAKNGLYDAKDFSHCLEKIEQGFQLAERGKSHAKLRDLQANIKRERNEWLAAGDSADIGPSEIVLQFRRREFAPLLTRFDELATSVTPRGILGGDDEKAYWSHFQFVIGIDLVENRPEEGLSKLDAYEQGRIAVRMTPIPVDDLQESILGYLANDSVENALARLQFWLTNSRMPCISGVIQGHPRFRHLFPDR